MEQKNKTPLYIAGGAIGLIAVLILIFLIFVRPSVVEIPELADSGALTEVVKSQIAEAITKAKRKPSSDNLGRLGMVYHSSANYKEAADCYILAIEKDESDWMWSYYLGYLSIEMGESNAVTENFSRVIEINPEAFHAWYYKGLEHKNRREFDQAETCFGNIMNQDSRDAADSRSTRVDQFSLGTYAKFQLARTYFDKGQIKLAENELEEILEVNHMFGPAYRLLGNIYSTAGDQPLSEKYGVRANDLQVFTPPVDTLMDKIALLSKSELYLLKKIDEAVNSIHPRWALELIRNGLQYFPENKDLISKAVNISLWMNSYELAFAYMNQHLTMFGENFEEIFSTGMLYFQKDLYPQSIIYLTTALKTKPSDLETQKYLAISQWRAGEEQESFDLLNAIINNNPDNLEVLAEVTDLMFFDLNQGTKAIDYLILLEHFLPTNPKVQKISAWMAENNGRVQEALTLYEASFEGDHEDFTTIKNLGSLLTREKMWKKAIQHYREALLYHPNEQYFLERLGTLLSTCPESSLRIPEEGGEYSERAFYHAKGQSTITIYAGRSLAMAYSALGEKQNARLIMNMTIDLARSENFSPENMAVLEDSLAL